MTIKANIASRFEGTITESTAREKVWFQKPLLFIALLFSKLVFRERIITNKNDKEQAYILRALVFGKYLCYPEVSTKRDYDEYDENAIIFGVFLGDDIVASARMLTFRHTFMLEKAFSATLNGKVFKKGPEDGEISRMLLNMNCLKRGRWGRLKGQIAEFVLYRYMYRWARERGIRYWYFNVDQKYFKKLRYLFGFKRFVPDHVFNNDPEATCTVIGDLKMAAPHLNGVSWLICRWFVGWFYNIDIFPEPKH